MATVKLSVATYNGAGAWQNGLDYGATAELSGKEKIGDLIDVTLSGKSKEVVKATVTAAASEGKALKARFEVRLKKVKSTKK